MRLFEAILDANGRAVAGDAEAGLHPVDYADELPVAALTCIDSRLNGIFPDALALPKEQFIWLRNAGNIVTGPLSSTMRSLALACAVKGAKEVAIIGHTDCQVCKTSTMKLTEAFRALGVERAALPENLTDYFGLFASERQNVMKAVDFVRRSPLIGPGIPVHGLLVDVNTGKLEWVVNGYQALEATTVDKPDALKTTEETADGPGKFAAFQMGEMKFPDTKIGEISTDLGSSMPSAPPPSAAPDLAQAPSVPAAPFAPTPPPTIRPTAAPQPQPIKYPSGFTPKPQPRYPSGFTPKPPIPPRIPGK